VIATVEEDRYVGDNDSEIDSEMGSFATAEVAAEMVDKRTLDGCKDTVFEQRAMFEVVEEVLIEEEKLDVGPKAPGKDIRRKDTGTISI
jgi:hypothetical protein